MTSEYSPNPTLTKYAEAIEVYLDWLEKARQRLEVAKTREAARTQREFHSMLALLGRLPAPETALALELKSLLEQTISAIIEKDKARIAFETDPASTETVERIFYWNVVAEKLELVTRQKYAEFSSLYPR